MNPFSSSSSSLFRSALTTATALAALGVPGAVTPARAQGLPHYDHIVVIIEENKNDTQIRGSSNAPYINSLIPGSADLTHFDGEAHPSQPNYLHFFSGTNQGVVQDGDPTTPAEPVAYLNGRPPFSTPNLGRELLNAGKSFGMFSQTLPYVLPSDFSTAVPAGTAGAVRYGYTGVTYAVNTGLNEYVSKHNPAVQWQNAGPNASVNALAPTVNRPLFAGGPGTTTGLFDGLATPNPAGSATRFDYSNLPSVSFVVPNEQFDMHDGSIADGDAFLRDQFDDYRQWAATHNSLFILTFDESDISGAGTLANDPNNRILTLISGQGVKPGAYDEAAISTVNVTAGGSPDTAVNHHNLLRTFEDIFGTANDASNATTAADPLGQRIQPITDIFLPVPEPGTATLLGAALVGGLGLGAVRRRRGRVALG